MKCVIFGSNGMLGSYMVEYLSAKYKVYPYTRKDFDIVDITFSELESKLQYLSENDLLINCAGMIPQANSTKETDYIKVNSVFPHYVQKISEHFHCKFIHITTDCVYSGEKGKYSEDDMVDGTNIYASSKYQGEPADACIIRTSIIGEEYRNKYSLLEFALKNKGKSIQGYTNQYWNGITCLSLCKLVQHMITNNFFWTCVRHFYSESVTKYDLLKIINNVYDLDLTINPTELPKTVDKTLTSVYEPIYTFPTLEQQIREQLLFRK